MAANEIFYDIKRFNGIFYRLWQNNIKYHMKYTAKNTNINLISCKAQKVAHNVSQMKIEIL